MLCTTLPCLFHIGRTLRHVCVDKICVCCHFAFWFFPHWQSSDQDDFLHRGWQDIEIFGWCYRFTWATSMWYQCIACINCCCFCYDWMKVLISKTKLSMGKNSLIWSYSNCCWDFIFFFFRFFLILFFIFNLVEISSELKIYSTRTIAKSRYGRE